jgi:hypothetical protein
MVAVNVVGLVVLSSLWSAHAYEKATTSAPARSYIATAKEALSLVPPGTEVVSAPVPAAVMSPAFFGAASNTSAVLGPLAPGSAKIRWTTSPQGMASHLMIFDGYGRLWPAIVVGVSARHSFTQGTCLRLGLNPVRVQLQRSLYSWPWVAELGYTGPATLVTLTFGGRTHDIALAAGHDNVFAPLPGAGSSVTVQNAGLPRGCLTYLTVGTLQASVFGSPVPAERVSG